MQMKLRASGFILNLKSQKPRGSQRLSCRLSTVRFSQKRAKAIVTAFLIYTINTRKCEYSDAS